MPSWVTSLLFRSPGSGMDLLVLSLPSESTENLPPSHEMHTVSQETSCHLCLGGYHELWDPLLSGLTMTTKKLVPGKAVGLLLPGRSHVLTQPWAHLWTWLALNSTRWDAFSQLHIGPHYYQALFWVKVPHTPTRDYDIKSFQRIMANKT